jgi:hypothetical protein
LTRRRFLLLSMLIGLFNSNNSGSQIEPAAWSRGPQKKFLRHIFTQRPG